MISFTDAHTCNQTQENQLLLRNTNRHTHTHAHTHSQTKSHNSTKLKEENCKILDKHNANNVMHINTNVIHGCVDSEVHANGSVHRIGNGYLSHIFSAFDPEDGSLRTKNITWTPKSYIRIACCCLSIMLLNSTQHIRISVTTETMLKQHSKCITTCLRQAAIEAKIYSFEHILLYLDDGSCSMHSIVYICCCRC